MPVNKLEGSRINKIISSKTILKDVNFLCDKGEITGLVGPNGSGKSSLFKVLSGLWNINSGDIKLDGVSFINNIDEFIGNIGSFIESPNLYEDLTARQNFEIMIKLHNIQNLDWYNFLIFKFNIDSYIDKKIKKYSLGMKQRIAIVMALITNPDIIILDEPTNSLDITSVRILHEILQSVKKDKIILISSHILEELESIADKVYILKVVYSGLDKAEIPILRYTFMAASYIDDYIAVPGQFYTKITNIIPIFSNIFLFLGIGTAAFNRYEY